MPTSPPITVVETPEFLAATRKLMDDNERAALVDYLARNPTVGDLIPGTGGVRKLRWGLEGRGKRGGARVVYFVRNTRGELMLITVYTKGRIESIPAHLLRALMEKYDAQ